MISLLPTYAPSDEQRISKLNRLENFKFQQLEGRQLQVILQQGSMTIQIT